MTNQNPEQIALDHIDKQLLDCGWLILDKSIINLGVGQGIAVREYQTDVGLADYVSFVDKKLVGAIEAKIKRNRVFRKQAGTLKFTEEQMQWLRMIKDCVANSFHIDRDDFDLSPLFSDRGLTKMWNLFGKQTDEIINELNESLAA